ncbi:GAF domain-containing protein [Pseudomonas sp. PDM14]|uniref:HD domain-containing phosphohydrolase n=1 Tax=Pseudomonas sp. PDM14 TaxID=2769288 RepID=UPI0017862C65|nr:HD domain-containing phosphohydrolase [Pseudomonas sp. PDM14]MBD9483611.1 GAF domain-containing protein [Pseudomonas sp. PDM14]
MTASFTVGHSPLFADSSLHQQLRQHGVQLRAISQPDDLQAQPIEVLLLDGALTAQHPLDAWQAGGPTLVGFELADGVLPLPASASETEMLALLGFAAEQYRLRQKTSQLANALHNKDGDLQKLVDVGLALSAEKDLERLLSKILTEGCRLSNSDAASLFLVDKKNAEQPQLIFKLTQNNSLPTRFQEQRMPLTKASIAGYVALTSTELNIADAYAIPSEAPYRFNRSFDMQVGYRTMSLLAIPMLNHRHDVVGVLEFINCQNAAGEPIAFDEVMAASLRALASQAAVAIENRQLLDDISQLFDGFVQASVFAIEQRDPTSSGHSFRVADLCIALAHQLPMAPQPNVRRQAFNDEGLRELRYAALLHDFGKVGVREHVLTKSKKLPEPVVDNLRYRVALAKESLQNQTLKRMLHAYRHQGGLDEELRLQWETELALECDRLDRYLRDILKANEPSVLTEGDFRHLQDIQSEVVRSHDDSLIGLLSDSEFCALAIRRGSLTQEERAEIERHVVHTRDFLKLIPWTPALQRVPEIAAAHHEKLDGSGYPKGLAGDAIPCASRIMTICDIYDALTASDRPYKPAVPVEHALDILQAEVKSGLLDGELVKVFIDSRCYLNPGQSQLLPAPPPSPADAGAGYAHHVCDFEPSCKHPH